MEDRQLRILLGVCTLFVICHTCRIVRNLEDLYLSLFKGIDIMDVKKCNEGCASPMSLLSHVSFPHKLIIEIIYKTKAKFNRLKQFHKVELK